MIKPLLKWPGGKAKLAPLIDQAFDQPSKVAYHEPFVGSASVFLYRKAQGNIEGDGFLSDINARLINFHVQIRDNLHEVITALELLQRQFPWESMQRGLNYRIIRADYNDPRQQGDPKAAARFLWLNRACFNGLYRENQKGEFNVAIGDYEVLNFPTVEHLEQVSAAYQGVIFKAQSFQESMQIARKGDQVYCDPPYIPLTSTAKFTSYDCSKFDMVKQQELAESAKAAASRGAHVVISNHDTPVSRHHLYPEHEGFEIVQSLDVQRSISCDGANRKSTKELLVQIGRS